MYVIFIVNFVIIVLFFSDFLVRYRGLYTDPALWLLLLCTDGFLFIASMIIFLLASLINPGYTKRMGCS